VAGGEAFFEDDGDAYEPPTSEELDVEDTELRVEDAEEAILTYLQTRTVLAKKDVERGLCPDPMCQEIARRLVMGYSARPTDGPRREEALGLPGRGRPEGGGDGRRG